MKHLVFVYGTLKRGGSNHRLMTGQKFISDARTEPVYRLYSLGDYPAMIGAPKDGRSIEGEIWEIDPDCRDRLDQLEGLAEGLYERVPIRMQPPHHELKVEGYLYLLAVAGRRDCGANWPA